MQASPELAQLDEALADKQGLFESSRRTLLLPVAALTGQAGLLVYAGGELPDFSEDTEANFQDLFAFQLALGLSYDLSTGGERIAETREARKELEAIQLERAAAAQGIEQRIRSAIYDLAVSRPGIDLARQASEAATKNLDLVTDAYAKGLVNIIQLIDAQNAAFSAQQFAESATYDFLVDLIKVQRAVGVYPFMLDDADRAALMHRLVKATVEPTRP